MIAAVLIVYLIICLALFFLQEKFIFFPEKLARDYEFSFNQKFEELNVISKDQKLLSGILFKSDNAKGLIFYLHGNAGALDSWGDVSKNYTDLNYDVFMLDYRGYGKSQGSIKSEKQLFEDVQTAYDELKAKYDENNIIILGYSLGTGFAAKLASANRPRLLILEAPFYSMKDMMKRHYPVFPTFLLRYKFQTNEYIKNCNMPIAIFHGDKDEVIYYGSSQKLKSLLKHTDTLITLSGQVHSGMTQHPEYRIALQKFLDQYNT